MSDDQKFSPILMRILDIVNIITYFALGGVAVGGLSIALTLGNLSIVLGNTASAHVYLVVFGYIIMMSQAVMSLNPVSGWARAFSVEHKRTIHLCMQVIGAILAISGSILAISRRPGLANRTSHGAMGITSMVFTFISLIGGCVHLFSIKQSFLPVKITKILHALCGSVTILFVFITYILGLQKVMTDNVFAMYTVLSIIAIIGILVSPITTVIRKVMN